MKAPIVRAFARLICIIAIVFPALSSFAGPHPVFGPYHISGKIQSLIFPPPPPPGGAIPAYVAIVPVPSIVEVYTAPTTSRGKNILFKSKLIVRTVTDENGNFSVDLPRGFYTISTMPLDRDLFGGIAGYPLDVPGYDQSPFWDPGTQTLDYYVPNINLGSFTLPPNLPTPLP